MKKRVRRRKLLYAFTSMVLGSFMVIAMVLLINRFADGMDRAKAEAESQIAFERKPPPKEQMVEQPKPKPKPKRRPNAPPPPLAGLGTALSGFDFGLPGFDMGDLDGLES